MLQIPCSSFKYRDAKAGRRCGDLAGRSAATRPAGHERKHAREIAATRLVSVIDDDASCRDGMNAYIESHGYKCATFCSAEEYLLAGAVGMTDCLVVDVQLPGMKGPDLQDRLIADGYRTPIIFVTGFADERTRDRVLRAGALGYLGKPCCEKTLSGCLEQAVGGVIGD